MTRLRYLSCFLLIVPFLAQAQDLPFPYCDDFDDDVSTPWQTTDFAGGGRVLEEHSKLRLTMPQGAGTRFVSADYTEQTFRDLHLSVDLRDWENLRDMGVAFHMERATLSGYLLVYFPDLRLFGFNRIRGGGQIEDAILQHVSLANTDRDRPDIGLRITLDAAGDQLTGKLYSLDDLQNPLAEVQTTDATFSAGTTSVFVATDQALEGEASFDDFTIYHPDSPCVKKEALPDPYTIDFNDSDLSGWEATLNVPNGGRLTLEEGGLRLTTAESGSQRFLLAALTKQEHDDFHLEADVRTWESPGTREIVLVARLQGETGYLLAYYPNDGRFGIWRADSTTTLPNLVMTNIGMLEPNNGFHLQFVGRGNQLSAEIYDLSDRSTPIASVETTDATYGSGTPGFLVESRAPNGPASVLFDNLVVAHPDNPPSKTLPFPGNTIAINPVLDGFRFSIDRQLDGMMAVAWTGGGHLQRLNDANRTMETVATTSPFLTDSRNSVVRIVDVWEGDRTTEVYVPSTYSDEESPPLLLVLSDHAAPLSLTDHAERAGFLYVNPQPGASGWDQESEVDNLGYLQGVIAAVQSRWGVNANRIYVYGHADGGTMAYRLAQASSKSIAGIAVSGITETVSFPDNELIPLHVLDIIGTGGSTANRDAWGAVAGHHEVMNEPNQFLAGKEISVTRLTGGNPHIEVVSWHPIDTDEEWTTFASHAIDWLLQHSRSE